MYSPDTDNIDTYDSALVGKLEALVTLGEVPFVLCKTFQI